MRGSAFVVTALIGMIGVVNAGVADECTLTPDFFYERVKIDHGLTTNFTGNLTAEARVGKHLVYSGCNSIFRRNLFVRDDDGFVVGCR